MAVFGRKRQDPEALPLGQTRGQDSMNWQTPVQDMGGMLPPTMEQGYAADGMPLQDLGGPMPGGFPGMMPGYPEPTTYLKEMLRYDDYLDDLGHQLHADRIIRDEVTGQEKWKINENKPGTPQGPMLNMYGIEILKSKLSMVLNKFATHANLTDEEIHGYTFENSMECLYFIMTEAETYQIQDWARHQILNLIDGNTYMNLSRTLGGAESTRIGGLYQAKDINPGYQQRSPGFFEGLMSPLNKK